VLTLNAEGRYTVSRSGQPTSSAIDYRLASDGLLTLDVVQPGAASTRYFGAYQQTDKSDATQVYYFTDRFAPAAAPVIGMYWGTRTVPVTGEARGAWHLFTQEVIFAASQVLDPDNVARTAYGSLTIAADADPNKPDVVTGTGVESTGRNLTYTGTAPGFADGRVDLLLSVQSTQGNDAREFVCSRTTDVVLGVDEDDSDGESGLIGLVRKFDAPTTKAEVAKLAGTYHFGMQTIFVSPSNAGLSIANGELTFSDKGGWSLEGLATEGSSGVEIKLSGAYSLADDGRISLTYAKTNETWIAAVDPTYQVLLLVDPVVEGGTGGFSPELKIMMGIKKR
jgi:hypothetical protein